MTAPDANHFPRLSGLTYLDFFTRLHGWFAPRTYFEIGTETGQSLQLSRCASLAVDLAFQIRYDIVGAKPACTLIQQPSDRFFQDHDPTTILHGPIDLAFLDGMHLFEFLLRDFLNTERYCRPNSVIALHDCAPPGFFMTVRDRSDSLFQQSSFGGFWTGDVWKVVPALKALCPDLSISVWNCPPTGLVLISNLNPDRPGREDIYRQAVQTWSSSTIDRARYDAYWADLTLEASESVRTASDMQARFWL